jgi:hypothetical protein
MAVLTDIQDVKIKTKEERKALRSEMSDELIGDLLLEGSALLAGSLIPIVGSGAAHLATKGIAGLGKKVASKGLKIGAKDIAASAGGFGAQQLAKSNDAGVGTQIAASLAGAGAGLGAHALIKGAGGIGKTAAKAGEETLAANYSLPKLARRISEAEAHQGIEGAIALPAKGEIKKQFLAQSPSARLKIFQKTTGIEHPNIAKTISELVPQEGETLGGAIMRMSKNPAAIHREGQLAEGGNSLARNIRKENSTILEGAGLAHKDIPIEAGEAIRNQVGEALTEAKQAIHARTAPLFDEAFNEAKHSIQDLSGLTKAAKTHREGLLLEPHIEDIYDIYKNQGHEGLFAHINSSGALQKQINDKFKSSSYEGGLLKQLQEQAMSVLHKQSPKLKLAQEEYKRGVDELITGRFGKHADDYLKKARGPNGEFLRSKKAPEKLIDDVVSGRAEDLKLFYNAANGENKSLIEQGIINRFAKGEDSAGARKKWINQMEQINPAWAEKMTQISEQMAISKAGKEEAKNVASYQRIGPAVANQGKRLLGMGLSAGGILGKTTKKLGSIAENLLGTITETKGLQQYLAANPLLAKELAEQHLKMGGGAIAKKGSNRLPLLLKSSLIKGAYPAAKAAGRPVAQKKKGE